MHFVYDIFEFYKYFFPMHDQHNDNQYANELFFF